MIAGPEIAELVVYKLSYGDVVWKHHKQHLPRSVQWLSPYKDTFSHKDIADEGVVKTEGKYIN